jgi:hypothetical protein
MKESIGHSTSHERGATMQKENNRAIRTPENEFIKRKQELFTMNLIMPVQFKNDWHIFKKQCRKLGVEFEDVLGNLIIQFNNGDVSYTGE